MDTLRGKNISLCIYLMYYYVKQKFVVCLNRRDKKYGSVQIFAIYFSNVYLLLDWFEYFVKDTYIPFCFGKVS